MSSRLRIPGFYNPTFLNEPVVTGKQRRKQRKHAIKQATAAANALLGIDRKATLAAIEARTKKNAAVLPGARHRYEQAQAMWERLHVSSNPSNRAKAAAMLPEVHRLRQQYTHLSAKEKAAAARRAAVATTPFETTAAHSLFNSASSWSSLGSPGHTHLSTVQHKPQPAVQHKPQPAVHHHHTRTPAHATTHRHLEEAQREAAQRHRMADAVGERLRRAREGYDPLPGFDHTTYKQRGALTRLGAGMEANPYTRQLVYNAAMSPDPTYGNQWRYESHAEMEARLRHARDHPKDGSYHAHKYASHAASVAEARRQLAKNYYARQRGDALARRAARPVRHTPAVRHTTLVRDSATSMASQSPYAWNKSRQMASSPPAHKNGGWMKRGLRWAKYGTTKKEKADKIRAQMYTRV